MDFAKAYSWITSAQSIVCLTHTAPDIDGIASMIALYKTINQAAWKMYDPQNFILLLEELPRRIQFLPGAKEIKAVKDINGKIRPELLIIFDAHCPKRINDKVLDCLDPPERAIIFDHHQKERCPSFAPYQIELINPEYPSTTALLYDFITKLDLPVSPEIATLLLAGLYYDTGGFRYENVSATTFLIASQICSFGASPSEVARAIFSNRPLSELMHLRSALNRMKLIKDGKAVLTYLTKEDFDAFGKELNDIASFFRDIEGTVLSILVKELDHSLISVSLRSKPPFEALALAKEFGGGGHKYACGFRVSGKSLEETIELIKNKLEEFLTE